MSAFICGPEHIGALVDWYCHRPQDGNKTDEARAARLLGRANVLSVMARYKDLETEDAAVDSFLSYATMDEYLNECIAESLAQMRRPMLPPVWVLAMLACFEYQACETPEWYNKPIHENEARTLYERIKGAAIRALDGYDAAPWEFHGQVPPPVERSNDVRPGTSPEFRVVR